MDHSSKEKLTDPAVGTVDTKLISVESHKAPDRRVTWGQIAWTSLVFVLGITAALAIQNIGSSDQLQFSTVELITFVFGIALAAASVVLAFVAIDLGKGSERVMIERSDHSIRLQHDIYQQTTEALAKIGTSTGVTEKRVEDIVAGRVGLIVNRVAEEVAAGSLTASPTASGLERNRIDMEQVIEEIQQRLIATAAKVTQGADKELYEEDVQARLMVQSQERQKEQESLTLLEEQLNKSILQSADLTEPDFLTGSQAHYIFDHLYDAGALQIGLAVLPATGILGKQYRSRFADFLLFVTSELAVKVSLYAIIVLSGTLARKDPDIEIIQKFLRTLEPSIGERIRVIHGSRSHLLAEVPSYVASLVESIT